MTTWQIIWTFVGFLAFAVLVSWVGAWLSVWQARRDRWRENAPRREALLAAIEASRESDQDRAEETERLRAEVYARAQQIIAEASRSNPENA